MTLWIASVFGVASIFWFGEAFKSWKRDRAKRSTLFPR